MAHFPDIPHKQLPYAIKQLISHEVEVEKMRREEGQPTPLDTKTSDDKKSEDSKKEGKGDKSAVPNHLNQKLKVRSNLLFISQLYLEECIKALWFKIWSFLP